MNDQTLLSDLCTICNAAIPKYCCPGCNTRTCSLACYKRHKVWSQCSGKRDPGAYVKRSQLATPAGIDRDYNFLTGIERAFDAVDRDAERRGISVPGGRNRANGPVQGSNLQQRLDASGAIIRRAPVGMSRQKSNKTQWMAKHKCLAWTVEWVHPDGTRSLGQCREFMPLHEAYQHLLDQIRPSKKRKLSTSAVGAQEPATGSMQKKRAPPSADQPAEVLQSAGCEVLIDSAKIQEDAAPSSSDHPAETSGPDTPASQIALHDYHFYLHKPQTSSTSRVIIPVAPTSTFSTCLQGQTILEYPTIYVLRDPPEAVPPPYQLEADYKRDEKKLIEELDEHESMLGSTIAGAQQATSFANGESGIKDSCVLDSLERDLAHVKELMES